MHSLLYSKQAVFNPFLRSCTCVLEFEKTKKRHQHQHQPAQSITLTAAQRSLLQHVEKSKMTGRAQGRAVDDDQLFFFSVLVFHFQEQL